MKFLHVVFETAFLRLNLGTKLAKKKLVVVKSCFRNKQQAYKDYFHMLTRKTKHQKKSSNHSPKSISAGQICVRERKAPQAKESSVQISHTIYPVFNRVRAGK
jgi:hypothetical protein